jgi:hypothetical protein
MQAAAVALSPDTTCCQLIKQLLVAVASQVHHLMDHFWLSDDSGFPML